VSLSPSAQKVQDALDRHGLPLQVVELPASTRTAQEAAAAIGCRVEQIAKSLVFQGKETGRVLLVIASGKNRVDERKLEQALGEPAGKAPADLVRSATGFVIGGVPPVGHTQPLRVLIDADLLDLEEIWAAAGTPNAVFRLLPSDLVRITGGAVLDIKHTTDG
jgi:prolyl-tRNA editing enzyme YbaK/EbsC (Cys-tRNA(Pro) deacylase)